MPPPPAARVHPQLYHCIHPSEMRVVYARASKEQVVAMLYNALFARGEFEDAFGYQLYCACARIDAVVAFMSYLHVDLDASREGSRAYAVKYAVRALGADDSQPGARLAMVALMSGLARYHRAAFAPALVGGGAVNALVALSLRSRVRATKTPVCVRAMWRDRVIETYAFHALGDIVRGCANVDVLIIARAAFYTAKAAFDDLVSPREESPAVHDYVVSRLLSTSLRALQNAMRESKYVARVVRCIGVEKFADAVASHDFPSELVCRGGRDYGAIMKKYACTIATIARRT